MFPPAGNSAQDGVDERARVKRGQVIGSLAEADELDGNPELPLDGDDDAALRRAVE
jgi:hypothetical protein